MAVFVERRVQVVRSAFVGIIGKVQHIQRVRLLHIDTLVREQFTLIHLAHVGVGKLSQVALDMSGRKA